MIRRRPPFRDVWHGLDGPHQVELSGLTSSAATAALVGHQLERGQRRQDQGHAIGPDIIEEPESSTAPRIDRLCQSSGTVLGFPRS